MENIQDKIKLTYLKYNNIEYNFNSKIYCLVGKNNSGKTKHFKDIKNMFINVETILNNILKNKLELQIDNDDYIELHFVNVHSSVHGQMFYANRSRFINIYVDINIIINKQNIDINITSVKSKIDDITTEIKDKLEKIVNNYSKDNYNNFVKYFDNNAFTNIVDYLKKNIIFISDDRGYSYMNEQLSYYLSEFIPYRNNCNKKYRIYNDDDMYLNQIALFVKEKYYDFYSDPKNTTIDKKIDIVKFSDVIGNELNVFTLVNKLSHDQKKIDNINKYLKEINTSYEIKNINGKTLFSDGYSDKEFSEICKSYQNLIYLFYSLDYDIIFIDEIEVNLDSVTLNKVLKIFKNKNAIVSCHNDMIINELNKELIDNVYVFSRKNNVKNLSDLTGLNKSDTSIIDKDIKIIKKIIYNNKPNVIICEDFMHINILEAIIKLNNLNIDNFEIISAEGCHRIHHYTNLIYHIYDNNYASLFDGDAKKYVELHKFKNILWSDNFEKEMNNKNDKMDFEHVIYKYNKNKLMDLMKINDKNIINICNELFQCMELICDKKTENKKRSELKKNCNEIINKNNDTKHFFNELINILIYDDNIFKDINSKFVKIFKYHYGTFLPCKCCIHNRYIY